MTEIKDQIYRYRHYIGVAAAVLLVCQQVYHRIFRIPKNLRHLPAIPYGQQLKALQSQENLISRTQRLVFPLLSKANGVYLVCFFDLDTVPTYPRILTHDIPTLESDAFSVDNLCGRSRNCQDRLFQTRYVGGGPQRLCSLWYVVGVTWT